MELLEIVKMNHDDIRNLLVNHDFFSKQEIRLAAKRIVQLNNDSFNYWEARKRAMKFQMEFNINPEIAIKNLKSSRLKT